MSSDTCDAVLERIFLDGPLDPADRAHSETCARCLRDGPLMARLARELGASVVPDPPAGLTRRVVAAATPLAAAARPAARAYWRQLRHAVAVAVLPLPLIVLLDAYLIALVHAVLRAMLPATLSAYLTFNFAALTILAVALTYAAVPLLADRQIRLARRELGLAGVSP
jgi:hypothetical protein